MDGGIIVFGRDGQLGRELGGALAHLYPITCLSWRQADFSRPEELASILERFRPKAIVNASAYTNVDLAETERRTAELINAKSPQAIAKWAKDNGALLIHYSTDYVFDGTKNGPYLETDKPCPLNVYGLTKSEGDQAIMESGAEHLIFRTSWVYSVFGKNFPATMLKLSSKMDKLTINTDQIGAPTSAELLASVTARALERHLSGEGLESGIYNLTAGGHTSWMDYAKKLFVFAIRYGWRFKSEPLTIIPSQGDDPLRPAKRPKNSRLSTEKIQKALSITLPPWEYHLERYVQDLCRLSIFKPSKPFRNYLEKN